MESAKLSLDSIFMPKGTIPYVETPLNLIYTTILPAKSDSDFMFCLQSYQGLIIDRSLVY